MPSFADALGIHLEAVTLRARRAEILATNLANADTPGYKARDIDFRQILNRYADPAALRVSHPRHLDGVTDGDGRYALLYRQPSQASLDQNTVDVQAERAAFLDNSLRYQASITFLNGRLTGLVSALRGE
ncbi:MAG: flagellar basal body rod protein FlgB [Proteobacteria bacterium]|nr:flagellar basal body rod protein FlgB [Pseudomonadota bacterium]